MNKTTLLILIVLLAAGPARLARSEPDDSKTPDAPTAPDDSKAPDAPAPDSFNEAAAAAHKQLSDAIAELNTVRQQMADEQIPLSRRLGELQGELLDARAEYQQVSRVLDSRTLDLSNLRSEIKTRHEEAVYLSNLLSEYIRKFESDLHIAELQRYEVPLEAARLAPENTNLSQQQIYETQAALLSLSLDRLDDVLGGVQFDGTAVNTDGIVEHGTFVMFGPAAIFQASDGLTTGTAEQRLGSLEPAKIAFGKPSDAEAARRLITTGEGLLPLDPTLGNAHKIESTHETLWQHIQTGGVVMVPIFVLAGAALLVALYKWISLMRVRRPSRRRIQALLDAVTARDVPAAMTAARSIKGPTGKMLTTGVEHLGEPRELVEEIMYETVLTTRLKLQRLLPFIAISASSAPLLGLLGTVTGIINTFKLITVFGTGDVKMLSGGISEALVTTEYGLIVAIPSLLLHAFLSRKAKGVIDQMEKSAVAFVNQVGKSWTPRPVAAAPEPAPAPAEPARPAPAKIPVALEVRELVELLVPMIQAGQTE